jgi:MYXO-CTERM domain-containing protein
MTQCPAPDACHLAGVCEPASGVCTYANKPNGMQCTDGNPCTADACIDGACQSLSVLDSTPCTDKGNDGLCIAGHCLTDSGSGGSSTGGTGGGSTTTGTGGGAGGGTGGNGTGGNGNGTGGSGAGATGAGAGKADGVFSLTGGGCSTTGGHGSSTGAAFGALALALALSRRRRNRAA